MLLSINLVRHKNMNIRLICFIWFFIICYSQTLFSQNQEVFKQISVEQGLSNNRVTTIVQDRLGFIWIGTKNGLNKYDASGFKEFNQKNSQLKSNDISVLHVDKKGRIWIGTIGGGINIYNPLEDSFEKFNISLKNSLISLEDIHAIIEDKLGNIWIGSETGLSFISEDLKKIKTYTIDFKNSKERASVWSIIEGNDNNLWIGTYGEGLFKFDTKTKKSHNIIPIDKLGNVSKLEFINTLMYLNNNELLIGSNGGGLLKFNLKNNTISKDVFNSKKIEASIIRTIEKDRNGNIWIGTDGDGVFKVSIDKIKSYQIRQFLNDNRLKNSLANNTVNTVFEDNQSNIWLGTAWKGIDVLERKLNNMKLYFSDGKGYNSSPILSVFKDNSYLWMGTDGKGLSKYNIESKSIVEYNSKNRFSPGENFIQCIKKRKNGQFWLGTFADGFLLFDEHKGIIKHYKRDNSSETSLPYNDVRDIIELESGALWIATWGGGLSYLDVKTGIFKNFKYSKNNPNSISSDNVISLLLDDSGLLWVATYGGGLNLFNPKSNTFKHYKISTNNPKAIGSNYVFDLLKSKDGSLWLATKEGLNKFDIKSRTFKKFEIGNTTNTNTVVSLIDDNQGNIWMGTKTGIFKYNLSANIIEKLQGSLDEFHFKSVCKDDKGLLYFGGINGVISFDPNKNIINKFKPKVLFTDFKVFDKAITAGEQDVLNSSVSVAKDIFLKYNQSVITFEFSALEYPFSNARYLVKMDGFETNWRDIGGQKSATYTNLSPGDYVFNVKIQNSDKTWNDENVTKINIKILPPLWRTWWAYVLYFLFIIFILWMIWYYTLKWMEVKNNLRLEKLQREQEDRIHELKQRFFTNISHEIRTPLTLIIGTTNNLMKGNFNSKEKKQLTTLKSSTSRLMNLVTELLNIRKLETGHIKLHVNENNLVLFVYEIFLAFSQHAISNNIDYRFEKSEPFIPVWFDKIQLEKTIYNLLTNAFKFTQPGNKILVIVKQKKNYAKVVVRDTGKGIPEDRIPHIFERFYQNDDVVTENLGFGIGLSIAKDVVELHSGEIEVKSKLDKGTSFSIILPKGNFHFKPEEIITDVDEEDKVSNYNKALIKKEDTDKEFKKATILIVEDNVHLLEYLTDFLSQSFQVVIANDGKMGLQIAQENMPDLIVSDVMMPEMDGITMCYELKTNIMTSHIPVILLTARTMVENIMEGFEMGADDYLVKPFNEEVLKVRIKNLLSSRKQLREKFTNEVLLSPKEVSFTSPDQEFLIKLNGIIEKYIDVSEFNIDQLADEINMSHSNLYKKIKGLTGMTTVAFIRDFRLKRASQLLRQNASIVDVCFKVGYTNRQHFSLEFKKKFSMSPSDYIKNNVGE